MATDDSDRNVGAAPSAASNADATGLRWVPGLIAGEAAAFDGAFVAFQRRVFAYVVRMTKQRELAEDIVQETFVRLAHHATRLRLDTNLRAWLFAVAHRLVISHVRAAAVRSAMTNDLMARATFGPPGNPFASPMEAVAESRTQAAIERGIAALPETYREVVVLVAIEQLELTDVAQILGLSNEAVRQRLSRARRLLAEHLQPFDASPRKPT
ncbi:MAG TPA: RNA polymerase sigma factor [Kofleriaceae bacterium]|nr:RNA polymerase sigma factor [Kofleriaceae bacterium]